jgi:hypothetical protein
MKKKMKCVSTKFVIAKSVLKKSEIPAQKSTIHVLWLTALGHVRIITLNVMESARHGSSKQAMESDASAAMIWSHLVTPVNARITNFCSHHSLV